MLNAVAEKHRILFIEPVCDVTIWSPERTWCVIFVHLLLSSPQSGWYTCCFWLLTTANQSDRCLRSVFRSSIELQTEIRCTWHPRIRRHSTRIVRITL